MTGLNYTAPKSAGGDEVQKALNDMWAGINTVEVKVTVTGTTGNLKISVASNVDSVLSDRLKKITGEKIAEYQAKLRAQIDALTDGKKNELMGQFNAKKDEYQKRLTAQQAELQSKSDAIKQQIADKQNSAKGQVDAEKKKAEDAAKTAADAEKKKQEDQIKKQAEDKLKNMFK